MDSVQLGAAGLDTALNLLLAAADVAQVLLQVLSLLMLVLQLQLHCGQGLSSLAGAGVQQGDDVLHMALEVLVADVQAGAARRLRLSTVNLPSMRQWRCHAACVLQMSWGLDGTLGVALAVSANATNAMQGSSPLTLLRPSHMQQSATAGEYEGTYGC